MYRYYSRQSDIGRVSVVGEIKDGILNIAVSLCSYKDQFVRKVGRNIAEGRLAKGKIYDSYAVGEGRFTSEQFAEIASKISRDILVSAYIGRIKLFK